MQSITQHKIYTKGAKGFVRAFVAAFVSAWVSFGFMNDACLDQPKVNPMLETGKQPTGTLSRSNSLCKSCNQNHTTAHSMEMTLFLVVRAMEASTLWIWDSTCLRQNAFSALVTSRISDHLDSAIFAISSGTIMWAWFYLPGRLAKAYENWIDRMAQVDKRLIDALRTARCGLWKYGEYGGDAVRPLQGMCEDHGLPLEWGDPKETVPIPCEIVHQGTGPNCHWHAITRFFSSFRSALVANVPIQLLAKIITRRRMSLPILWAAAQDAIRSSSFLAAFVASMYYSICLARTILGPKLGTYTGITPQRWDSGLAVAIAAAVSGMSILIEEKRKRSELAMFVAPKALATLVSRQHDRDPWHREQLAFSLSVATLFASVKIKRPPRGLFGRLLKGILSS